jgi:hypothetical protein
MAGSKSLDNDLMWLLFCRWKPMCDEMYEQWLALNPPAPPEPPQPANYSSPYWSTPAEPVHYAATDHAAPHEPEDHPTFVRRN